MQQIATIIIQLIGVFFNIDIVDFPLFMSRCFLKHTFSRCPRCPGYHNTCTLCLSVCNSILRHNEIYSSVTLTGFLLFSVRTVFWFVYGPFIRVFPVVIMHHVLPSPWRLQSKSLILNLNYFQPKASFECVPVLVHIQICLSVLCQNKISKIKMYSQGA